MLPEPFILKVAIGDVAEILNIPKQTINSWRNAGLLPGIGQSQGPTQARLYGFDDMVVFAVLRDMTSGPAGISGTAGADIAQRCRDVLLAELAGLAPEGSLLVVEAGAGVSAIEVVAPDKLADYIARWRRDNRASKRTRLEIIDLHEIALRTCAKLAWFDGPKYEYKLTEEQVRDMVEPVFRERAAFYLRDEIEDYKRSRATVAEEDR